MVVLDRLADGLRGDVEIKVRVNCETSAEFMDVMARLTSEEVEVDDEAFAEALERDLQFVGIRHEDPWFFEFSSVHTSTPILIEITEENLIEMIEQIHSIARTFKGCGNWYKIFSDVSKCTEEGHDHP